MRNSLNYTLAVMLTLGAAGPVSASERDRAYADSFGNLVIETASGAKRIVVGQGAQARRLDRYAGSGPAVVYANEVEESRYGSAEPCYRPPYLVKGRSYMYGFDEGVIPFQGGPCQ